MNLTDLATQIAPKNSLREDHYAWIDDHKLLTLSLDGPLGTQLPRFSLLAAMFQPRRRFELSVVDIPTKSACLLDSDRRKFSLPSIPMIVSSCGEHESETRPDELVYHPAQFSVSPNGEWLLHQQANGGWRVVGLSDKTEHQWRHKNGVGAHGCWLSENVWVGFNQNYCTKTRAYSIDSFTRQSATDAHYGPAIRLRDLADGILAGVTSFGSAVFYWESSFGQTSPIDRSQDGKMEAVLNVVDLTVSDETIVEPLRIHIRFPYLVEHAWSYHVSRVDNLVAWLLQPTTRPDVDHQVDLWISNLDGSDFQYLGSQPVLREATQSGEHFEWPSHVQWSPAGHQVSFAFDSTIWIVPVPPK